MKELLAIFSFLCFSSFLSAQSVVLSPKIDFTVKDLLLKDALIQLSYQTKVAFSAPSNLLPEKKVSLHLRKSSISNVLQTLLKDTQLSYKVENEQVVLFESPITKSFFTISGYIKEKSTGERLPLATVFEEKMKKGVNSNEFGFYSISLLEGNVLLSYSYAGLKSLSKKVSLHKDETLDIYLESSNILAEVIVSSKKAVDMLSVDANQNILPMQKIKRLPSLGGEVDLMRTISMMPGVNTGPDGFGGISIRGGDTDQNLVLLDGVPVYSPMHTGGLYSIFDEQILQNVQLYKGNAPARYGGRLSSVLDVKMKEGNQNKMVANASLGLTTAKVSLEGPIQQGKSSFIFALRKSLFNTYLKPISRGLKRRKGDTGQTEQAFSGLNTKVNFSLGKKDHLYASLYHGADNFQDENRSEIEGITFRSIQHEQDLNWGNTIVALRWNHLFNDKLFANAILTSSKFHFQSKEYYQEMLTTSAQEETLPTQENNLLYSLYQSSIADKAVKFDFNYIPSTEHTVRFGAEVIEHTFRPGAFSLDRNTTVLVNSLNNPDTVNSYSATIHSQEYSTYLEDNINISDHLVANLGVRASLLAVQGVTYWSFLPRFSTRFKASDKWIMQADFGKTNQNVHLLTSSGLGLPSDLWVPATANIRPQTAWQGSFGTTLLLSKGLSLEVTAYQKFMNRLIAYQEGSSFLVKSIVLNASDWESKVAVGKGRSYGIEFCLKKEVGHLKGSMNYTYSKSTRQFDALNFGETYNFKFDRPHSLKITSSYEIHPKLVISANWSYQTGLPTTLPASTYTFYSSNLFLPITALNIGKKNSFRLPSYHHLDVEMQLELGKTLGQQVLKLGIYNVYNRRNPLYYRLKEREDGSGEKEFVQVSLLPIFPSLSYAIRLQ